MRQRLALGRDLGVDPGHRDGRTARVEVAERDQLILKGLIQVPLLAVQGVLCGGERGVDEGLRVVDGSAGAATAAYLLRLGRQQTRWQLNVGSAPWVWSERSFLVEASSAATSASVCLISSPSLVARVACCAFSTTPVGRTPTTSA